ncbi:hypothetical protein DSUL_20122 [Desulfovibrionales bacterium]
MLYRFWEVAVVGGATGVPVMETKNTIGGWTDIVRQGINRGFMVH